MMDRQGVELFLTLIGIFIFLLGGILAWLLLPWLDREQLIIAVMLVLILLGGLGFVLSVLYQNYIVGTRRLAEEISVSMAANPAHRVQIEGLASIKELAKSINIFADRFQAVLDNQTVQIEQAQAGMEEERNRLAALMSELTEGVLVCNMEGRILLYNSRAKLLLGQVLGSPWADKVGGFVGLGRSVFGLIDRNAITHALENVEYRREKQNVNLASQFVTTATNGQLIRAHLAPVLTGQQEINGFVLTLEDITRQSQASNRRDMLLQALTEGVRASLANIRAAIETIEQFPDMDLVKLTQLRKVIHDEALLLSGRLNQATNEYATNLKADWQLEEMLDSDLLWAVQRRFEDKLQVKTTVEELEENLWLKVDSYSVVQAMTYIMRRLKTAFGIEEVCLRLKKSGQLAAFDLAWHNGMIDMDTLWAWQNQSLATEGEGSSLTLREVAERHGGEVWCQADKSANVAYFRLLLPTTEPKRIRPQVNVAQSSRPEYYDFDLFHQPGQTPELDQRPLTELTHTVFDTETTGLDPSGGDEIISISAIRVVNGRLLRQEVFDQLVDPKRVLSRDSIKIHGISPQMLEGQPTIEQVLPVFFKFAEGTVLVAHNAAFDMRLLQLKEAKTGIKFTNPVLDTLLLAAAIYPNQTNHGLESLAEHLGINIIGRHTSLGDAILTGEIFLKLIPVLANKGIVTMADARNAAQETYYTRLNY